MSVDKDFGARSQSVYTISLPHLWRICLLIKTLVPETINVPMHVHDYSISQLRDEVVGKDHPVSNFVDGIKLMHMLSSAF